MSRRWFPSATIARYVARLFLWRTAGFLVGLVGILLTLDLLGESGRILAVPGNGEAELWRYALLRAPQLVALFLPFSVLLAALLTFLTLNQHGETVIFRATGLSAHQILGPMVLAGLVVAGLNFLFNELVLVRVRAEFDRWKAAGYAPIPPDRQAQAVWVRSGTDLILAGSVDGTGLATRLSDVTVFVRAEGRLARVIRAAQATPGPGGWRLHQVRLLDVATGRERRQEVLELRSRAGPEQFTTREVRPETTPFWRLWPAIRALKAAGRPTDELEAGLHHKISGPLSSALMPLLAAVAGFGLARSGRLFLRAVVGLAMGFAFFVADNFAMAMAGFGNLPPALAAWAPLLLFLLIGETVLLRSEE
ncbi:MAG: LPS export ABC transporter permease LptG [Sphingomonadaceae bacterium]|nr:LPS export ABC transporter permease LptG [Sphingomonadaceae bacterium]